MNTGAEAVETALKTARRWGAFVKGVPDGRQRIVCCAGNFHGRTISIIGMSTDESARRGFAPFTEGFDVVPYGDVAALERAVGPTPSHSSSSPYRARRASSCLPRATSPPCASCAPAAAYS